MDNTITNWEKYSSKDIRRYIPKLAKILVKKLEGVDNFNDAFAQLLDSECRIELHSNKFDHTRMIVLMKWCKTYEDLGKILYYFDPSLLYDPVISKLYATMEKIKGETYYVSDKIFILLTKGIKKGQNLGVKAYKNIQTYLVEGFWSQNGVRNYVTIYKLFYRHDNRNNLINMHFKTLAKRLPTEKEKVLLSEVMNCLEKIGLDPYRKKGGIDYMQWRKQIGYYIQSFIKLKEALQRNPTKQEIHSNIRKQFFH